ncbi:MAG: CBS domain-containing protein [Planctomycetota bacterium]
MSHSIGTTRVEDVMNTVSLTVDPGCRMDKVARLLDEHDVNAAPVVDQRGVFLGIITSHDVVEFESTRAEMQTELNHGYQYNLARYGSGSPLRIPGQHFNEAGFNMTRTVKTADPADPVSSAARKMCSSHVHHIVVLDSEEKPVGILSSLDILGLILGEPVCRSPRC